jgi:CHASE3 domain sensor protein
MKKYIDLITYLFLGCLVIAFLSVLFYLTQENYVLLKQSNDAVIKTYTVIRQEQLLSNDFRDALIYYSTDKLNTRKEYVDTYGASIWEISGHMDTLKKMVDNKERKKLDSLSVEIDAQVSWMASKDASDPKFSVQRNEHFKIISSIQDFFNKQISELQQTSAGKVKEANRSLVNLHNWIIAIIITSSLIIFATFLMIYLQFSRVKKQNERLREIAWIQSHEVRAQVAILMGLGQLFDLENIDATDNHTVVHGILDTSHKLDEIVRKINSKTE